MRVTGTISTKDHLCDYCIDNPVECPKATHLKFGDGVGNDNVIECSEFKCRQWVHNFPIVGKPELGIFKSGENKVFPKQPAMSEKKENYRKGNKLILEFDGWTIEKGMEEEENPFYNRYFNMVSLLDAPYFESWQWLMPVIEAISKQRFDDGDTCYPRTFGMIDIETGQFMFRFNRYSLFKADTLIEATYMAVVERLKDISPANITNK